MFHFLPSVLPCHWASFLTCMLMLAALVRKHDSVACQRNHSKLSQMAREEINKEKKGWKAPHSTGHRLTEPDRLQPLFIYLCQSGAAGADLLRCVRNCTCVSRSCGQSGTNFNINVYQWVGTKEDKQVWIIELKTDLRHNTPWLCESADRTQCCTELKSMTPPAGVFFCKRIELHSLFIWVFSSGCRYRMIPVRPVTERPAVEGCRGLQVSVHPSEGLFFFNF